jgi:prefoldin subunit 5
VSSEIYEKLGVFYLGRPVDAATHQAEPQPLLYDSRDLLTHAVCVGMTGSGKTGLGIGLIEEAAIDGVPALVIDPKGDLTNLLLTFPDLRPTDFEPWINLDDASRAGLSKAEYAVDQADRWRQGLASWDQDGERIRRLREAAEFAIFTPGSSAGIPISVLASFAAPAAELLEDADLAREKVATTVSSLLGLMGLAADPIQSRDHILLSTLLADLWKQGKDADLAGLIRAIQDPPMAKVGVLDVDTFYPPKERTDLALRLNNLLASPGFQSWLQGVPLDVGQLLYAESGRPRVAVLSIAHLSDSERMFFVALLLNELIGWMRSRSGTSSLRAILYMDEVFGFMPPLGEPPSKRPLLTLLKQARAYGVGVVLATQNPADLDYKGLSNTGTWMIGRLQTERDKMRILEGLAGVNAQAGLAKPELDRLISGLGKREFLLHNVHESHPVLFQTRWVMAYMRGPLTRNQISDLMKPMKSGLEEPRGEEGHAAGVSQRTPAAEQAGNRPIVESGVEELFYVAEGDRATVYRPHVLGQARVHFVESRTKLALSSEEPSLVVPQDAASAEVDWSEAEDREIADQDLNVDPEDGASYLPLPAAAAKARSYTSWKRSLSDHLYRTSTLELLESPTLQERSNPGESERDFRIRLADRAREKRDEELAVVRTRYARKVATLEERIRKAELRVAKERDQAKSEKLDTAISFGTALLGVFTGRKGISKTDVNRAGSAIKGVGRSAEQQQDVVRAEETVDALTEQLETLNEELTDKIDEVTERYDPLTEELEAVACRPRRADIEIRRVALMWAPD